MLDSIAMSQPAREHVLKLVDPHDPAERERRRSLTQLLLKEDPDLEQEIQTKGRLTEARAALRRVLSRRGIVLDAADEARIDACTDHATLERWLDEAAVATSTAEVFRSTSG
jgi:hypothetical protein